MGRCKRKRRTIMKKLLFIFLLFPFVVNATNYTWSTGTSSINISDSGPFGNLNAGDTVFIPVRSGDWYSYSVTNCDSGTPGGYIVVYWMPGAKIAINNNTFNNYITNSSGVKTVGMEADNNPTIWRMGTTGYNNYIWFDSCSFNSTSGFGPYYTGALTAFNGNIANSMHHWKWTYCSFLGVYTGNTSGVAITIGGNFPPTRYSFWFDTEVSNCTFSDYPSNGAASNFISAFNCYNTVIRNNTFTNLGVVATPTGHAAVINAYAFHGQIYNNLFGPFNFGNAVRGKFAHCPSMGAAYTGLTKIYNNIIKNQRKYPGFEVQSCDTTGYSNGGVVLARNDSTPYFWNNTAYNLAVGVGNSPYIAALIDDYLSSAVVTAKNNVWVLLRDSVCSPNAWVQGIVAASGTSISYDTARNRFNCTTWTGFADSTLFTPSANGMLNNTGLTPPSWLTTDIYGNARTQGGGTDIGAVERSAAVVRKNLPLIFF